MGVKEAAIVGGILGGAGGAGGAYAADLGGIRTGGGSRTTSIERNPFEGFELMECTKDILKDVVNQSNLSKVKSSSVEWKSDHSISTLTAESGCLFTKLLGSDNKKADKVFFELTAWDKASSQTKGVVIWSVLSKGTGDQASLTSRVFCIEKETNGSKWNIKKGLEFSSSLSMNSKISSNDDAGSEINKILKTSANEDAALDGASVPWKGKKSTWTKGSDSGVKLLTDYLKIKGESNSDKFALFFGRDWFSTNELQANITGVYESDGGWKGLKTSPTVSLSDSIFEANTKGSWS